MTEEPARRRRGRPRKNEMPQMLLEEAWVGERTKVREKRSYFAGWHKGSLGAMWDHDINAAVRFCRESDAIAVCPQGSQVKKKVFPI